MALYRAQQYQNKNMRAGQMKATYGDARVANTAGPQQQQQQQQQDPLTAYQQSKQQTEAIENGIQDAKDIYQWYSDRNWDPKAYDGIYGDPSKSIQIGNYQPMKDINGNLISDKAWNDYYSNIPTGSFNGNIAATNHPYFGGNFSEAIDSKLFTEPSINLNAGGTLSNGVAQGANAVNFGGNMANVGTLTGGEALGSAVTTFTPQAGAISIGTTPAALGTSLAPATTGLAAGTGATTGAIGAAAEGAGAGTAAAAGGIGALGTAGIGLGVLGLGSLFGWW